MTTLLLQNKTTEDDCRNVIAGCLGQLALLSPQKMVPTIQQQADSTDPLTRAVMLQALKSAVTDQPHPIDQLLPTILPSMLQKLADPDWYFLSSSLRLRTLSGRHHQSAKAFIGVCPFCFQLATMVVQCNNLPPMNNNYRDKFSKL